MKTITTNLSFVKLYKEQSKKLTAQWLKTASGAIQQVKVYATDSHYENGKEIPDADVTILNQSADGSIGFQYEYAIPFNEKGELEPYDYYFQIISVLDDKTEVIYNAHSFYKPDGNPGTEGDSFKPVKP